MKHLSSHQPQAILTLPGSAAPQACLFSQIGYNGRKQMWGKGIFDLLTLVSKIQIKGARVWNIMRSAENASWNL